MNPTNPAPELAPKADQAPPPGLSPEEQKKLEEALKADLAAQGKTPGEKAVTNAGPAASPTTQGSGITGALSRAWQSLNPDISGIIDFAGGFYDGTGIVKSGDDPGDTGANLQELELAFQATVDPYFRADIFLTIPNLRGIEVEEAYLTTTSLPGNLQIRAGIYRAPFGRQNTQHLHLQDFTRRPQMNALFLGPDGLRSPGAELSWLAPLPFYLLITGAAYSVGAPDTPNQFQSFGGGSRKDLTYLGNVKTFAALSDATSLLLGFSFAAGQTAKLLDATMQTFDTPHRSYLYGADAYLKWKPPNVSETYMSLAWTTEYYLRQIPDLNQLDGAVYSQLVWQVARRWYVGVRGEIDGIPSSDAVPRQYAGSGSVTLALSEFARVRLYGEGRYTPNVADNWSSAAFLQLEAAIGAHGAHPY